MANIGVKPVRKGMGLVHPLDGPLDDAGGSWREDQFTFKRLVDGDIKRIEPDDDGKASKPSAKADAGAKSSPSRKPGASAPEPNADQLPAAVEGPTDPSLSPADGSAAAPAKE
jgi:hypothetical protein